MKCSECGFCCKLFLINLTEDEYNSGIYKTMFEEHIGDFEKCEMIGANILSQNKNEECIYLSDKKCSIHDQRPFSCRNFFCNSKEETFQKMIIDITNYKTRIENASHVQTFNRDRHVQQT